jgi:FtsP/CotA-like multicopper oxidase with cupredoxin domain
VKRTRVEGSVRGRLLNATAAVRVLPDSDTNVVRVGDLYYDEELVILLQDWYHRTADETLAQFQNPDSRGREVRGVFNSSPQISLSPSFPAQPVPDDVLLNGVQLYDCGRAISKIDCDVSSVSRPQIVLDSNKRYRLRLVNGG